MVHGGTVGPVEGSRVISACALTALLLISTASCQTTPTSATPNQDAVRQVTLAPGESRRVDDFDITVTFEALVEDSRCPTGVSCITEGDAAVRVRVDSTKVPAGTYTLHTGARFDHEVVHGDVLIRLETVNPYPAADARPRPDDYRVTLSIRRR